MYEKSSLSLLFVPFIFRLENSDIKSKQLQLGIPYNTTPAQINAINQSISYANSKGVQVVVTKIK
ncbi:MAG: hypothetical protein AB7D29_07950 [Campylobacterales bacterium]